MAVFRTTPGQLMVNAILPEDLRSHTRVLDKKGFAELMREVAQKHPDKYVEITKKLSDIGWRAAQSTGGFSFGPEHLLPAKAALAIRRQLRQKMESILDDTSLTDKEKDEQILAETAAAAHQQRKEVMAEVIANDNPLVKQVISGARGNEMQLMRLLGSDMLYVDHHNRPIPFPVLKSYSEGLSPAEFWAASYGARRAVTEMKEGVRDAGYLGKVLAQVTHRQLVTGLDAEEEPKTLRGFPVDTDDDDSEGALLAAPAGGYPRNTVLTPRILGELRRKKVERILLRSPIAGGLEDGGLYARDVGVREFGRLPQVGELPALTAVQSLSESISQGRLASKHGGGVVGTAASRVASGFDYIFNLVNPPKLFPGGAAHAELDGNVTGIEAAPTGGWNVYVGDQKHYVSKGEMLKVKRGDRVEAGDVLSTGAPNPHVIVQHKGIGEGRRYFVDAFRQAMLDAGLPAHRRNVELLAKGLIGHVKLTEEAGPHVPGDIVQYHAIEQAYEPREGFKTLKPREAVGKFLERPYLHHTIGAKLRPSMLADFANFGVESVDVHDEPPPFEPVMIRGVSNLQHDPDWMTKMYGSNLSKGLLEAARRGSISTERGTSFVPGLARSVDFGEVGLVKTPLRVD